MCCILGSAAFLSVRGLLLLLACVTCHRCRALLLLSNLPRLCSPAAWLSAWPFVACLCPCPAAVPALLLPPRSHDSLRCVHLACVCQADSQLIRKAAVGYEFGKVAHYLTHLACLCVSPLHFLTGAPVRCPLQHLPAGVSLSTKEDAKDGKESASSESKGAFGEHWLFCVQHFRLHGCLNALSLNCGLCVDLQRSASRSQRSAGSKCSASCRRRPATKTRCVIAVNGRLSCTMPPLPLLKLAARWTSLLLTGTAFAACDGICVQGVRLSEWSVEMHIRLPRLPEVALSYLCPLCSDSRGVCINTMLCSRSLLKRLTAGVFW